MKIKYFVQNIKISEQVKEFIEKKISKLERYFENIRLAEVDLSYNSSHSKNEVIRLEINHLHIPKKIFRAVVRAKNVQEAVNKIEPKLKRQLSTLKGSFHKKIRDLRRES